MNCLWQDIPDSTDERGWRKTVCRRCGHETAPWPFEQVHHRECPGIPSAHEWRYWVEIFTQVFGVLEATAICKFIRWRKAGSPLTDLPLGVPRPDLLPLIHGPGTELKKILDMLGIEPNSSCQCASRQQEMNARGCDGCVSTKTEILGWLTSSYDESSLSQKATALGLALSSGLPLSLEGILDESIRRACRKDGRADAS